MIDVSSREARSAFYNSANWRQLRQQALERDRFECVWCRDEGRLVTDNLEVDHIKELEFHPEFALDIDNLRTLCKECHNRRHGRFQYRKWQKFQDRLFRSDEWWG